jgi:N-acetylglucosaminyldiphosphoundecaprenol N-acetyl-beta-D-mannosaminyltransferase
VPEGNGRSELMGLHFDAESMHSAVDKCVAFCAAPRAPHTVITANAGVLCMMRRDTELREACRAGDLILADGMSVVWALRAAGTPVPERVTGVDLMGRLLEEGAARRLSVYFLGAKEEVVAQLVQRCAQDYPGLVVAGYRNGYFSKEDNAAIVEDIRAKSPHLLFVAMPSPFKEVFCERYREQLNVPVLMGVGGSFDVLAGEVRRAPQWLRNAGMEWFWRLLMEPRKMWKRYLLTNSEFLWVGGREVVGRRLGAAPHAGATPK